MERKLASIQRIIGIEPIEGADAIEKATVLGWECVVAKKDGFAPGQLVVYIEVDSIVPEKPEFEFLRPRKFRVRTIRLRGQVSQGLVLPLTVLPKNKYTEGTDVTKILGIRKYDPQADLEERLAAEAAAREKSKIKKFLLRYNWFRRLFSKQRATFPRFIKKTDEDRIQLFPHICEEQAGVPFEVTEKLDGQSATYFLLRKKKTFGVCSRKLLLTRPDNSSYWGIAKKHNMEQVLRNIIGDAEYVAVQGEIIGPSIQGNKYGVKENQFYAFNLIYPGGKVENLQARMVLEEQGVKFVPELGYGFILPATIAEMVALSNGTSAIADTLREGIVVRNYTKNISFKVVSPEFLLKHGE